MLSNILNYGQPMKFTTFFFFLFLLSISLCLSTTFFPTNIENMIPFFNLSPKINLTFIGLFSLTISILSYIGLMLSYYLEQKKEKARMIKLQKERKNIKKIHAELEALQKA